MGIQRILVVMAMRAEAAPVVQAFDARPVPAPAGRTHEWHLAHRGDATVAIAVNGVDARFGVDGIGPEPAVMNTLAAIDRFRPDLVVSAGTSGGWQARGGAIGKVYLSYPHVVRHDRRIDIDGFRDYGIGRFPVVPMRAVATDIGAEPGVVTTGGSLDETADDAELMEQLDARAKEMEAAAVAWVCETLGVPFVALKTITDMADVPHPTAAQFLQHLHTASAQLTEHLVLFVDRVAGRELADLD
jgi:5'-methylthioadenosine nucleosidase